MLAKKIWGIFFSLLYLSFVVLQYNDPDPAVWMAVYGAAALLCFLAVLGKVPPGILWSAAVLCVAGAVFMWPERFEGVRIGEGDITNIEEAREALGLLLCAVSFAGLALLEKRQVRHNLKAQQLQKARWAN